MKWMIYLLLLVNIGFFAWHYQSAGREDRRMQAATRGGGAVRLVTLKEARERQPPPASEAHCYSLGPFPERGPAEELAARLAESGLTLKLRTSNDGRRKGYWVYLAPAASYAEARKTARRLKKKHHIKDIFVVGTGEKKNGISLGVFSKFELAYRRQSEIRKLGFDAQLKDVKLPAREYWLDWPEKSDAALTPAQQVLVDELAEAARIAESDCSR